MRGSAAARGDARDPLAPYQAVLDGASTVAIAPGQAAKLRALAAELASQRAYLVGRKREAEAELGRALAAASPDETRVLAAYDRIAAQDAALGRAQLVARLGARAVLDAQQRSAIEGGTPHVADGRSRVTVKSAVASSLYIDGRYFGETPVTTNVTPGKHEVRLEAPGYDPLTNHFEIGESSRVVLDLDPEKRGARLGAASASAAASASGETGSLTLTTRPWTSIYLDGKMVGRTPIDLRLTKGRHEIKMVDADQQTRKTMTLDVTPGQRSNLSFSFDD
ncbi:MAG TPA: PEGA domain-containing protein [Kofleriaceae bacterium]|nr:PEGA domain-containing protein [Kofleriaceae bacterium]